MTAFVTLASAIAVGAALLAVSRREAVHGLLYLVVSLLAVAVIFFLAGASFAAALEVILYAGAVMVLFVFVVMILAPGPDLLVPPSRARTWLGPSLLAAALLAELVVLIAVAAPEAGAPAVVGPRAVALALYGPYLVAVELASLLLLAGLVAAYHVGRRVR